MLNQSELTKVFAPRLILISLQNIFYFFYCYTLVLAGSDEAISPVRDCPLWSDPQEKWWPFSHMGSGHCWPSLSFLAAVNWPRFFFFSFSFSLFLRDHGPKRRRGPKKGKKTTTSPIQFSHLEITLAVTNVTVSCVIVIVSTLISAYLPWEDSTSWPLLLSSRTLKSSPPQVKLSCLVLCLSFQREHAMHGLLYTTKKKRYFRSRFRWFLVYQDTDCRNN